MDTSASGEMPVIASCGAWKQAGWFLQRIGRGWRWHVGGVDCDGGRPALKQWMHVVATCDGRALRVFQDGVKVAEKTGDISRARWSGELHIGQYGAIAGPEFQTIGRVAGLRIYHRPTGEAEAAALAQAKPPQP